MMKALAQEKTNNFLKNALLVFGGALFIALAGKMIIRLPFTVVPMVIQNNLCLMMGLLLGARRGMLAAALVLASALFGMPSIASGVIGLSVFVGPTAGYLIGYIFGAGLAGVIYDKVKGRKGAFLALMAGLGLQYLLGALHLSNFVGLQNCLMLGVLPFLAGDIAITAALSQLRVRTN